MKMNYTKTLADYAVGLKYEDIPKEVVEQAKLLTLHTLGVALAACATKQGKEAIALAKAFSGDKRESTILGDGSKVSCIQAGFANGALADILDWEDCSWTGHPSANAIPAALAVGEMIKASGKDYITSVVAGYEVYQRIAMAVQPTEKWDWFKRGWGLTSWEIFAGAIPAAKLFKLSEDKMAQAIGVAGVCTPIVNIKHDMWRSNIYHYQHGLTCRDGIVSAFIAQSGINGLYDMLDGETGYWVSVSDNCDWDWMTKGLGKDYLIMETYFKHWPTNMWINQPLDAVDAIVKAEGIKADDVAEVIVEPVFEKRMDYKPEGYSGNVQAQFSIPFCIATMLLEPEPGPNWYTEEKLKDPKLLELASKVKATGPMMKMAEAFVLFRAGDYPEVSVEIVTKDGRRFKETIIFPKGHPKNRMTVDEFKDRFRRAASFALKPDKIESAIEKILNLEEVADVSEIGEAIHN